MGSWTDIHYSCGHTGRKCIYGKDEVRQGKIDVWAKKLCSKCFAAKEERDKEIAECTR